MHSKRLRLIVQGQVQGVGFRPFVFTLAEEFSLTGLVCNSPHGVLVEIQGNDDAVDRFADTLLQRLPPLARVTKMSREQCGLVSDEDSFVIAQSSDGDSHAVLISPDTAMCPDCRQDIASPANRRYLYPFTNCTNCGPRYSITRSIPYDRSATSMACFPMCAKCREEYENPRDRRFHAQPNACPVCGPHVWWKTQTDGETKADAAIRSAAELLQAGGIAAIKGLGGFHLACDACNTDAVTLLRHRKCRPHKPFAVMAANLEEACRIAVINHDEKRLLLSPEHPIVLCPMEEKGGKWLSGGISPDSSMIGIMLPYTPLHHALFKHLEALNKNSNAPESAPSVLVMTSGNPGGEPICLGNREALEHLGGMADGFLFHDRDILIRVDDSVVRPLPGRGELYLRRARGYVPRPIALPACLESDGTPSCILGVGAELKNTLCLTKGNDSFVSQHIGDMSNLETAVFHSEMREHLTELLKVRPQGIVRDLHPDYLSSRMAEELGLELEIPVRPLQHHFAHAHAVLAEHEYAGKALVLTLDGTGLGDDNTLWGGELLLVDTSPHLGSPEHKRLACFAPMDLPGGETAIREPWRIAHALLLRLGLIAQAKDGILIRTGSLPAPRASGEAILPWLPEYEIAAKIIPTVLSRNINSPISTSCGRLFDAVSALLGLCNATTYEGQAAIKLENAQTPLMHSADSHEEHLYPCPFLKLPTGLLQLDTHTLFTAVFDDVTAGIDIPTIARRFHMGLVNGLAELTAHLAASLKISHVGLSGGCFTNATLTIELSGALERRDLTPLLHTVLPPGDGCISLGQSAWGRRVFSRPSQRNLS